MHFQEARSVLCAYDNTIMGSWKSTRQTQGNYFCSQGKVQCPLNGTDTLMQGWVGLMLANKSEVPASDTHTVCCALPHPTTRHICVGATSRTLAPGWLLTGFRYHLLCQGRCREMWKSAQTLPKVIEPFSSCSHELSAHRGCSWRVNLLLRFLSSLFRVLLWRTVPMSVPTQCSLGEWFAQLWHNVAKLLCHLLPKQVVLCIR